MKSGMFSPKQEVSYIKISASITFATQPLQVNTKKLVFIRNGLALGVARMIGILPTLFVYESLTNRAYHVLLCQLP